MSDAAARQQPGRPRRAEPSGTSPESAAERTGVQAPEAAPPPAETPVQTAAPRRGRRRWHWWAVLLAGLVALAGFLVWRSVRPTPVHTTRPTAREIREAIAATGRVVGRRESVVGAQVTGTVAELYVQDGAPVAAGQPLARLRSEVAEAQVLQAEQAVATARAGLAQAREGARPTEAAAARARVREAEAAVQQRAAQLDQARAALRQAEARASLAARDVERYRYLLRERAVARQRVEQAETEAKVARADVTAAREAVQTAQATVEAARASAQATRADLQTLLAGPKQGGIALAQQRVADAERALNVARQQAGNYVVRAPYAGTITEILAEPGVSAQPGGVLRLVETGSPEIELDLDESNLAEVRVGQQAVITFPSFRSQTFRDQRLEGSVTEVGPRVDPARGTVTVTVVPRNPPEWLRPGQTVDVSIITAESTRRLVVPRSALRREGDRRVVLVVREGRALAQPVIAGPAAGEEVPILEGLTGHEFLVREAQQVMPGARVRARSR